MKDAKGDQQEEPVTLDGLVRARLRAVQAPAALRDRVRALIALETQCEASSDSQWRT